MQIRTQIDVKAYLESLGLLEREFPFVIARALTMTATDARSQVYEQMRSVFDRPTPFIAGRPGDTRGTMGAFRVLNANKRNLQATMQAKTSGKVSAAHVLEAEVEGGSRKQKRVEKLLQPFLPSGSGKISIPERNINRNMIDRFGNLKVGMVNKIRSAANAGKIIGAGQKDRQTPVKAEFILRPGATPVLFQIARSRKGRADLRPILAFVQRANYRERLDLKAISEQAHAQRFQINLEAAARAVTALPIDWRS